MKVVVTGGAGFIGANLCRRLLVTPGVDEVVALDDLSTGFAHNLDGVDARLVTGDMVDPEVIHTIVDEKRSDLAVAAAELIDLANQNGGRDNISVVLVRVPKAFLPSAAWAQRYLAKKRAS